MLEGILEGYAPSNTLAFYWRATRPPPRPLFEKRGAKTFIKKFFIRLVMRGVRVDRSIASLAGFFALLTDGRIAPASI